MSGGALSALLLPLLLHGRPSDFSRRHVTHDTRRVPHDSLASHGGAGSSEEGHGCLESRRQAFPLTISCPPPAEVTTQLKKRMTHCTDSEIIAVKADEGTAPLAIINS